MKIRKMMALPALGLFAAGCTVHEATFAYEERPPYHDDTVVVVADPPPPRDVIVVQQPPRSHVYAVRQGPPAPYVERIPPRPRGNMVWVPGYWVAERNRWVWVSGRYETPPRQNAVWVEPSWQRHGDEFRFSVGFWR